MANANPAYRYVLLALLLITSATVLSAAGASCPGAQASCSGGRASGSSSAVGGVLVDPSSTTFTTTPPSTSTSTGVTPGSGVPLSGALILALVAISAGIVFYAGARLYGRQAQENKR